MADSDRHPVSPPRWVRLVLRATALPADRPYLLAELDEEFEQIVADRGRRAAARWYRSQALRSAGASIRARLRRDRQGQDAVGIWSRVLRPAVRSVSRHPGHAAAVVGTLSLGVASATLVYSVAESTLLRPLPYVTADRLVHITSYDRIRDLADRDLSGPDFFDLRRLSRTFESLAAAELDRAALQRRSGAVQVEVARVTPDFFSLLGLDAVSGRLLAPEEQGESSPRHAVLSRELAVAQFGNGPASVGRTLRLDGEPYLVIGVVDRMPPLPEADVDLWLPLPYGPGSLRRQASVLTVVGRTAAGSAADAVASDLDRVAVALETEYPASNLGRRFVAAPLQASLTAGMRPMLRAVTLAVSLLLSIAIVNAAGLVLLRCLRRARELRVRSSLGASPSTLTGQLVAEGLLVGAGAGLLSAGLAAAAVRIASRAPAVSELLAAPLSLNVPALAVAVGLAVLASLSSTALAVRAVRPGSLGVRGAARPGSDRIRAALLGGQVAVTVVLLVCVALLGQSLASLLSVDPGFDAEGVVAMSVALPEARYPTDMATYPEWPEIQAFYERVSAEASAVPGVEAAALAWHHPLRRGWMAGFHLDGQEDVPEGERDRVNLRAAAAGYLELVGARMLTGRSILDTDRASTEPVVVVNRAFERRYFPEGALDRRLSFFGRWWRIVGVADDFKSDGLGVETRPAAFPPLSQMPSEGVQLVVRGDRPVRELLESVREAVWRVDRELAPADLIGLERELARSTAGRRLLLALFAALGSLATALAVVGLAGAAAQTAEARRRELAIRQALGARRVRLVGLLLGGTLRIALVGAAAGVAVAAVASRALEAWLYAVSPNAPRTYVVAVAVLAAAATVAVVRPVLRALREGPTGLLSSR